MLCHKGAFLKVWESIAEVVLLRVRFDAPEELFFRNANKRIFDAVPVNIDQ